jgi:hypothetical protein
LSLDVDTGGPFLHARRKDTRVARCRLVPRHRKPSSASVERQSWRLIGLEESGGRRPGAEFDGYEKGAGRAGQRHRIAQVKCVRRCGAGCDRVIGV